MNTRERWTFLVLTAIVRTSRFLLGEGGYYTIISFIYLFLTCRHWRSYRQALSCDPQNQTESARQFLGSRITSTLSNIPKSSSVWTNCNSEMVCTTCTKHMRLLQSVKHEQTVFAVYSRCDTYRLNIYFKSRSLMQWTCNETRKTSLASAMQCSQSFWKSVTSQVNCYEDDTSHGTSTRLVSSRHVSLTFQIFRYTARYDDRSLNLSHNSHSNIFQHFRRRQRILIPIIPTELSTYSVRHVWRKPLQIGSLKMHLRYCRPSVKVQ
jgi:hypothetical protein